MRSIGGCLILLVFAATSAAQLPEAWQHWRYSAPIQIASSSSDRLVSVLVPSSATTRARRDWIDLRVIDSHGDEVPFVLHARLGGKTSNRSQVPLLEPSAVEGSYQQAVADTGSRGAVHNSIRLHLETGQNLLSWVEIAVSGDLKDWQVVRAKAPIYVLRAQGMGENTDVSYPDSASRYVRIRILDGSGKYKLRSAEVGFESSTIAERVPTGVVLVGSTNRPGQSVWTSDADASAIPVSRVEFQTTRTSFRRFATVESSDDGERWRLVKGGDILRQSDDTGERAWMTIDFPEEHARRWRITVNNRNDPPVADLRPALLTAPRRVVLRAAPRRIVPAALRKLARSGAELRHVAVDSRRDVGRGRTGDARRRGGQSGLGRSFAVDRALRRRAVGGAGAGRGHPRCGGCSDTEN